MAELGHRVCALDVSTARVEALAAGRPDMFEPGLPELLAGVLPTGRLSFGTDPAALADADVHFLCVGTPQRNDGPGADLSQVAGALDAVIAHARPGALVVGKSTVPVGTAAELRERLDAAGREDLDLIWNPEFLREGLAVGDTMSPDRLVYGVPAAGGAAVAERADAAVALLDRVYASMLERETPRLVTDYATAELVKVAANSFLATKVSFINAMSRLCETAGGDVVALAHAIGLDERIGPKFLQAGLGYGGGCLPKDVRALVARADELGAGHISAILREVDALNSDQRRHAAGLVTRALGVPLGDATVVVLGAAFKAGSDDIRDSPALDLADRLRAAGAEVRVHDPEALERARRERPGPTYVADLAEALRGVDAVVLATDWPDYLALDPAEVKTVVDQAVLVDTRNALDLPRWQQSGWDVHALGRAL